MIRIVCVSSPVTLLPIRALLDLIPFHPQNVRQKAMYALLYPFSSRHRKALQSLSYVERVPEAQFIGFVTQWRVKRWMRWFAQAIAPFLDNKRVFFYCAEHMDAPTQLFLGILEPYVARGTINLMYGQPSYDGAYVAHHASCLLAEERPIVRLLEQGPVKLDSADIEMLHRAGFSAMLSANWWQAHTVFLSLKNHMPGRSHHALGLAERFFENNATAEWHLLRALSQEAVVDRIQVYYALSLLYLRFYPQEERSVSRARKYLDEGYRQIEKEPMPRETVVHCRSMLDAARALADFRDGKFDEALALSDLNLTHLDSLPETQRRNCFQTFVTGNKAQTLRALGRIAESCELNAQLVRCDPQMPLWWEEYVKCLYELHRFDCLQSALNEGLALHYDSARLHHYQGKFFQEKGQHLYSAHAFERAAKYATVGRESYAKAAEQAWQREQARKQAQLTQKHAV